MNYFSGKYLSSAITVVTEHVSTFFAHHSLKACLNISSFWGFRGVDLYGTAHIKDYICSPWHTYYCAIVCRNGTSCVIGIISKDIYVIWFYVFLHSRKLYTCRKFKTVIFCINREFRPHHRFDDLWLGKKVTHCALTVALRGCQSHGALCRRGLDKHAGSSLELLKLNCSQCVYPVLPCQVSSTHVESIARTVM